MNSSSIDAAASPHALLAEVQAALGEGQLTHVEGLVQQLTRQFPDFPDGWFFAGNLHYRNRRWDEAEASYRRVLMLQPAAPPALLNLGSTLREQKRFDEAAVLYEEAIRQRPDYTEAYSNLGNVLVALGRFNDAEKHYQHALKLAPDHAESYLNLAGLYRSKQRFNEAVQMVKQAIALRPEFAAAYNALGIICYQQEQAAPAEACYRQALAIDPYYMEAAYNLGLTLQMQGKIEEAEHCYQRLLRQQPDTGIALRLAMMVNPVASDKASILERRKGMEQALDRLAAQHIVISDPVKQLGQTNFYLAYQGLDNLSIQTKLAKLCLTACPSLGWVSPHIATWKKPEGRRIRLGFLSAYLCSHTMGKFSRGMIEMMPREQFEVVVFRLPGPQDEVAGAIDKAADRVIAVPQQLDTARRIIAEAKVDVLFYPDIGIDTFTYFLAYARLAPVQCVSWGHPDTTGIPTMDYFISSALIEPENAQLHYSERLALLPELPTYYYPPTVKASEKTRADFGFDAAAHLYVCPQNLCKFHPDIDELLAGILRGDPHGIVVLIEGVHAHWTTLLKERFAGSMPDVAQRVQFVPHMKQADFLALLRHADAVLDTPFFCGGTSSYEAFANGVPIVTLPGEFMRSRVTTGCYRSMQIDDLIATCAEHYVELALRLANDKEWQMVIAKKLEERRSVLFENPAGIKALSEFFVRAVDDIS